MTSLQLRFTRLVTALAFVLGSLVLGPQALAKGNLDAHVHGEASLMVALEGDVLELQFESPAANLLGFEHQAHSETEKAAVNTLKKHLGQVEKVLSLQGATCSVSNSSVDLSGVLEQERYEGHAHHKSEHRDEHHEHDKHDHKESSHSEISFSYSFQCQRGGDLQSLTLLLLNEYKGLESVKAQWITEGNQGSATLSSANNALSLR